MLIQKFSPLIFLLKSSSSRSGSLRLGETLFPTSRCMSAREYEQAVSHTSEL
eukprot:m.298073 g.298073  ORF g.298073 m.298073 type:complete len:52 (+) comp15860_c0_seq1:6120-6275(+)